MAAPQSGSGVKQQHIVLPPRVFVNTGSAPGTGTSTFVCDVTRSAPRDTCVLAFSKDTSGLKGKHFDGAVLKAIKQVTQGLSDVPDGVLGAPFHFVVFIDNNNSHRGSPQCKNLLQSLSTMPNVRVATFTLDPDRSVDAAAVAALFAYTRRASAGTDADADAGSREPLRKCLEHELEDERRARKGVIGAFDRSKALASLDARGFAYVDFYSSGSRVPKPSVAHQLSTVYSFVLEDSDRVIRTHLDAQKGIRGVWIVSSKQMCEVPRRHATLDDKTPDECATISLKFSAIARNGEARKSQGLFPSIPHVDIGHLFEGDGGFIDHGVASTEEHTPLIDSETSTETRKTVRTPQGLPGSVVFGDTNSGVKEKKTSETEDLGAYEFRRLYPSLAVSDVLGSRDDTRDKRFETLQSGLTSLRDDVKAKIWNARPTSPTTSTCDATYGAELERIALGNFKIHPIMDAVKEAIAPKLRVLQQKPETHIFLSKNVLKLSSIPRIDDITIDDVLLIAGSPNIARSWEAMNAFRVDWTRPGAAKTSGGGSGGGGGASVKLVSIKLDPEICVALAPELATRLVTRGGTDDKVFVPGSSLHHCTLAYRPSDEFVRRIVDGGPLGTSVKVSLVELIEGAVPLGKKGKTVAMSAFRVKLDPPEMEELVQSKAPHVTFWFDKSKGPVAKLATDLVRGDAFDVVRTPIEPPICIPGRVSIE